MGELWEGLTLGSFCLRGAGVHHLWTHGRIHELGSSRALTGFNPQSPPLPCSRAGGCGRQHRPSSGWVFPVTTLPRGYPGAAFSPQVTLRCARSPASDRGSPSAQEIPKVWELCARNRGQRPRPVVNVPQAAVPGMSSAMEPWGCHRLPIPSGERFLPLSLNVKCSFLFLPTQLLSTRDVCSAC